MKKIIVVVLLALLFVGCESTSGRTVDSKQSTGTCTASTYKMHAEPKMGKYGNIVSAADLNDLDSIKDSRAKLVALEFDVGTIRCKNECPLKHETLEYSIKHTIDFFDYLLEGDYTEADQSLRKAELNVSRFQDWTKDMP